MEYGSVLVLVILLENHPAADGEMTVAVYISENIMVTACNSSDDSTYVV